MKSRTLTTMLVGAALIVGCNEQNAPTERSEVTHEVAFNFLNGPANPGPVVMRFEDDVALLATDPARNLLSVNGLGVLDPNDSFLCGGASGFDIMAEQELDNPSGVLSQLIQGNGVTQHIWDMDAFLAEPTICESLNVPRLAEGTGHFMINDNDVFISGTRANSFGWKAQGTLIDLVNGGCARYTEEQRAIILPDGTFHGFVVENIHLHHIDTQSC